MIENNLTMNDIARMTREDRVLWNVTIEILNACNMNCKHCYIPNKISYGIEEKRLLMLIDELHQLGAFNIILTGGEPFLRNDILSVIKKIRNKGMKLTVFSNATLIDEYMAKSLSDADISLFSTTIFSMNHKVNDAITGCKGSLKSTLKSIGLLKKYDIKIEIKTPIINDNYYDYKIVRDYCELNGYKFFPSPNIVPKIDGDREPIKYALQDDKFGLVTREIKRELEGKNGKVENYFKPNEIICESLLNSLFIDCNGGVYPCLSWLYEVGNINKDSISDIWLHSKQLLYLSSLKKEDMKMCKTCKLNDVCTICPGDSLMDGDMLGCSNLQKKCAMAIKNMI